MTKIRCMVRNRTMTTHCAVEHREVPLILNEKFHVSPLQNSLPMNAIVVMIVQPISAEARFNHYGMQRTMLNGQKVGLNIVDASSMV